MTLGAIHDIGYRHYEGRRLGRAYIIRSLYVHNLRAAYGLGRPARAKVMPFLLAAMMLLPAAGSVAVLAITKEPNTLIVYSQYATIMQVVVAIFLATQAPVIASRELRFRVVPLYFSRPVVPPDFTLAKVGAFATALFVLLAVPVTVLFVGALVTRADKMKPLVMPDGEVARAMPLGDHVLHYLGALLGCVLFALVLAAIALVIAAFTPRRGFGVAAVIAVYMVSSTMVLIVQGIAEARTNFELAGWAGLFAPFNLVDAVQVRLLGAEKAAVAVPPGPWGGPVALALCALLVAGAVAVLSLRFRKAGLS
ncbi:ABC transporter permease [Actinomadura craniellae]|uniref:ABC transporter permease n=1 Tax=Actinomadura craniellae TaxID=2231787 RepID=A0A365H7W8_9ACTN|nr:ABC transporter permease [Actinomadura craniellae]RAY15118.1 ABC transporter permease [Actinomadura craniellae]